MVENKKFEKKNISPEKYCIKGTSKIIAKGIISTDILFLKKHKLNVSNHPAI